jgi:coenzyme A diphosphatase NUDT7
MMDTIKDVVEALDEAGPEAVRQREYSVLIPLLEGRDGVDVLFEVRADDLRRQPGEVCFPGGRVESGETPEEAAARETSEELLVEREDVEVLKKVCTLRERSGGLLHPFVGTLHGYRWTFSEAEVGEVFTVPLEWFIKNPPEGYPVRTKEVPEAGFPYDRIPGGRDYDWLVSRRNVYFYQYGKYTIWGITAFVMYELVSRITGGRL